MPYFVAFGDFFQTKHIFLEPLDVLDSICVYDITWFCEIQ